MLGSGQANWLYSIPNHTPVGLLFYALRVSVTKCPSDHYLENKWYYRTIAGNF